VKQLWLLVGGNGDGKSTFYLLVLEPQGLPFVNADRLARLVYPEASEVHSYEAAQLAEQQRNNLLLRGTSFCFEAVYSHPSKIDFAARAKSLSYAVIMIIIHLEGVELNAARVAQVKASIPFCDEMHVLDNSSVDDPLRPVITIRSGRVQQQQHPLPAWAATLLEE
jgi:predicted ABC-type ATPase